MGGPAKYAVEDALEAADAYSFSSAGSRPQAQTQTQAPVEERAASQLEIDRRNYEEFTLDHAEMELPDWDQASEATRAGVLSEWDMSQQGRRAAQMAGTRDMDTTIFSLPEALDNRLWPRGLGIGKMDASVTREIFQEMVDKYGEAAVREGLVEVDETGAPLTRRMRQLDENDEAMRDAQGNVIVREEAATLGEPELRQLKGGTAREVAGNWNKTRVNLKVRNVGRRAGGQRVHRRGGRTARPRVGARHPLSGNQETPLTSGGLSRVRVRPPGTGSVG